MDKITLAAARINAGLTQKKVSKMLGVTEQTIVKWESYKTFPNARQFHELCDIYHISMDSIILPAN